MCEECRLAHVFVLSLITDSVINRHRHYIIFALEISQLITGWATLGVIVSLSIDKSVCIGISMKVLWGKGKWRG